MEGGRRADHREGARNLQPPAPVNEGQPVAQNSSADGVHNARRETAHQRERQFPRAVIGDVAHVFLRGEAQPHGKGAGNNAAPLRFKHRHVEEHRQRLENLLAHGRELDDELGLAKAIPNSELLDIAIAVAGQQAGCKAQQEKADKTPRVAFQQEYRD